MGVDKEVVVKKSENSTRYVKVNRIYRHFKGKYYLVEALATNSETKETMVVYRHLYGDGGLCVRPMDMFLSEVDHEKYPDARQKYRFEEVKDMFGEPESDTGDMSYYLEFSGPKVKGRHYYNTLKEAQDGFTMATSDLDVTHALICREHHDESIAEWHREETDDERV